MPSTKTPLTPLEMQILEFERHIFKYKGVKDAKAKEHFGLTPTRYHQKVLTIIARAEAVAYDAQPVNRLRRLRDARALQDQGLR